MSTEMLALPTVLEPTDKKISPKTNLPPASWAYEGIECYVSRVAQSHHVPLYRAWNGSDHFYTASAAEYNGLPASYHREGIACYIADTPILNHVALFRLYSGSADDHFYCISAAERDNAVSKFNYTYEGIAGYVMATESTGHVALYRSWNPQIGDHFYTVNVSEIDNNGPTLSFHDLEKLLKNQLSGCLASGSKFYFADANYFCPTEAVAKQIITASKTAQHRYVSEVFDCDDFAHLLKAAFIEDAYDGGRRSMPYAFGVIWGNKPAHAMNVLVVGDGKNFTARVVEPQSGTIYSPSDNKLKEIYLLID